MNSTEITLLAQNYANSGNTVMRDSLCVPAKPTPPGMAPPCLPHTLTLTCLLPLSKPYPKSLFPLAIYPSISSPLPWPSTSCLLPRLSPMLLSPCPSPPLTAAHHECSPLTPYLCHYVYIIIVSIPSSKGYDSPLTVMLRDSI